MDELHAKRVARNEARFRALNQQTRAAVTALSERPPENCTIMCECAMLDCEQMITMSVADYQRVREVSNHFIVRPDHVIVSAERAIEYHEDWWMVEKIGAGARVAAELDPSNG